MIVQNNTLTEILNDFSYEMESVLNLISTPYKYNFGTIELNENGDVIFFITVELIRATGRASAGMFYVRENDLVSDEPLSKCGYIDWHKCRNDLDILQKRYKDFISS